MLYLLTALKDISVLAYEPTTGNYTSQFALWPGETREIVKILGVSLSPGTPSVEKDYFYPQEIGEEASNDDLFVLKKLE